MRIRGRHYQTGERIDLTLDQGIIQSVEPARSGSVDREVGWVAPALFDLQINGGMGTAFVDPALTVADVSRVVAHCLDRGISGLCPTLITAAQETLIHGFTTLARASESSRSLGRAIPCFHLEGPFISAEDGPRGAHPRQHVRPPDLVEFRQLQEAAGGRIRLVTLSPEYEDSLAFIETLAREGIVVAIGHTAATPARIRDAISAGARLSTHLGNGSHALLPRHDNYFWEQLADDRLLASFIPDGHHLPTSLLRCLLRVKSPARLVLTCDASALAGMPAGTYTMWGSQLEVHESGKVIVPGTPYLAGSGVFTDACVRQLLELGEVTLAEVLDMAGATPRKLLGLPEVKLEAGCPAELVFFEHEPGTPFRVQVCVA